MALIAVVVPLAAWEREVGALPGEQNAARWLVRRVRTVRVWRATQLLGGLAAPRPAAATVSAAALGASVLAGPRGTALVLGSAAAVPANAAIKRWMGATPFFRRMTGGRTDNFPSGHAVYATSVFGAVAWLAATRGRWGLATVAGGVVGAMGPARVMGRVHAPSDVVAGTCLGAGWLLVVVAATS